MSSQIGFRTQEEEVLKLLGECAELRSTLKSISAQIGRMENRVRRSFPAVAEKERHLKVKRASPAKPLISTDEALAEFDKIVKLVASGASEEAEKIVEARSPADLTVIAKEVGVSFAKSKPSVHSIREGIFGKVRESVLLTRHNLRT